MGIFDDLIDNFDGSKEAQKVIYQKIIEFRAVSKKTDPEERSRVEKKIAGYSNSLVK